METGTIVSVKLDRGFGFIHADGRDVFFHARDLSDDLPFDETLQERRVEFEAINTDKGERATNIRPAD